MALRENELKNAYIGEYVPLKEFSYNFVGKTKSGMESDGWTFANFNGGFDSNGIYGGSGGTQAYIPFPSSVSTAIKITINLKGTAGNSGQSDSVLGICKDNTGTPSSNNTYCYTSYSNYNQRVIAGNSTTFSQSVSGAIEWTMVLDLSNKSAKLQYTTGGSYSGTKTLTDAQVSNIKQENNIFLQLYGTPRITSIKVTVEYN